MSRLTPLGLVCAAALSSGSLPCLAQSASDSSLSGSVSLSARNVDVGGAVTKFREDVNLDDGVRLFDLRLRYAPPRDSDSMVDLLDLNASHLGGDPNESVSVTVRKYGAYRLELDHRRSDYFYEDTIVPAALANINSVTGGDFHHFDFERVRDSAALDLDLSPATRLSLGLERQTRSGDSTTTRDIERDEFELDQPIDESLNALTVGLQQRWSKVTLILQEEIREFENTSEIFLPGASAGTNLTDPAELQLFFLDQSYDYDSKAHLIRVLADPTPRFHVGVAVRRENLDLDMNASEVSMGTSFSGAPFSTDVSGGAVVGRDIDFDEIDLKFNVNERFRIIGSARSSSLDQSGSLAFGPDGGAGAWDVDTDGFELGAEIAVTPNVLISLGLSAEERASTGFHESEGEEDTHRVVTDRDGYFARLLYDNDRGLELSASIEDNSIDEPFALASATDNRRYRLSAKQRWDNGITLTASHRKTDVENGSSGWAADTEQTAFRLSYRNARFLLSGGYTSVRTGRNLDQLVTAGLRQELFMIRYNADSSFVDASGRWLINDFVTVGADVRKYENDGSFTLERDDWRAYVELRMTEDYRLDVAFRDFDYVEDVFDDYDAEILEVAIRLDW